MIWNDPLAIASLTSLLLMWFARAGLAQTVDTTLWVANGPVSSVVRDGRTIYIGGQFTQVGPPTGGGAAINAGTGATQHPYSSVAVHVRA